MIEYRENDNYNDEIEIIKQFVKDNHIDLTKTTAKEVREKRSKTLPIFDHECILKTKTFYLNNKLGSIDCIFFYPIEHNKEIEKQDAILFIHGGGWCLGGGNHKLPRELCDKSKRIIIYPLYSLSPEVKFPTAIEECYELLCILEKQQDQLKINFSTLIVGGDSAGGNLTIALSLLCKQRNGPFFKKQFLINPATDIDFNKQSYLKYGTDPILYNDNNSSIKVLPYYLSKRNVIWFYNQYLNSLDDGTIDDGDSNNILACPLKSSLDQLSNLPFHPNGDTDTLFMLPECDCLFDEGLEFFQKFCKVNNNVKCIVYKGSTHSFLTYQSLKDLKNSKIAVDDLVNFILKK